VAVPSKCFPPSVYVFGAVIRGKSWNSGEIWNKNEEIQDRLEGIVSDPSKIDDIGNDLKRIFMI
jgi:hypothetical protein